MKAAVVSIPGAAPQYTDFEDPIATDGTVVVDVQASSLSHVTRGRASGRHYSARSGLPLVPGIDGTGVLADGSPVYFLMPNAPFGGMGARAPVRRDHLVALPDGLDRAQAAALAIPGMSSWAALMERARFTPGERVLVNGATGTSG